MQWESLDCSGLGGWDVRLVADAAPDKISRAFGVILNQTIASALVGTTMWRCRRRWDCSLLDEMQMAHDMAGMAYVMMLGAGLVDCWTSPEMAVA